MDPRRELCKSVKQWLDSEWLPGKRNSSKAWVSVHGKDNPLHDQRTGTPSLCYRYMAFAYKTEDGARLFIKFDASAAAAALDNFNAEVTGAAVLASAGIAVGIASQDVLQNLAAGMYVCRMWRTLPMVVLSIPICLAHGSSVYLFSSTKLHV